MCTVFGFCLDPNTHALATRGNENQGYGTRLTTLFDPRRHVRFRQTNRPNVRHQTGHELRAVSSNATTTASRTACGRPLRDICYE